MTSPARRARPSRLGRTRRRLGAVLALGGLVLTAAAGPAGAAAPGSDGSAADAPGVAAGAGALAGASAVGCSATPFRSSPARKRWFRIPAVVRTGAGTLVAFAERRDTNDGSDTGDFDIVSTRSTDGGCHWSADRVIGSDGANRVSSPTPVVDAGSGDILLFSVVTVRPGSGGKGRGLYLQTSSDDGKSFSALLSRPIRPDGGYKGGLTGPGHAVQLAITHPGRLLVPMGYRTSAGRYGASAIYSDDHGASWHTGYDEQDTTGKVSFLEGTVAELPGGTLFISYRNKHDSARPGTARLYAQSSDGGAGLSGRFTTRPLEVVSVQGSSLALTGTYRNRLLFSAPADPAVGLRRDMTVFVSTDGGATWPARYQVELESTPGAYSDLVQVDDGSVGILYETGTVTWKERIAFTVVGLPALTHPTPVAAKLSYRRSAHPTGTSARAKVMTTVTVVGIHSPPGRVVLTATGNGQRRTASVTLTYSNRGVRAITLPRLAKGRYRLTLTYSGTGRIAGATRSAGILTVH